MAPRLVRTRDGRVLVYKGAPHPLDSIGRQTLPGGQYASPSTPSPISPQLSTRLPQSVLAPVPRSVVSPQRRVEYPVRTRETEMYQRSMTPAEYLRKKTFERPAYFAIEDAGDAFQTTAPWLFSVLVVGPAGTAVTGNLKITNEADFETVKIMVSGKKLVGQEWVATRNFLINFKDLASGRDFNNVPINAEHFGGDANEPLILPVTLFINRNTAVAIQFVNNEPVSTDIYVYFSLLGIKYYYRDALNLTTGIPEQGAYKSV